ncbi:unnamed protein product [Porites evermanni]|uniref:Uncharacterized protein n=1 Tax=Porites evermanni TaxID=104178 RepID=A0ABN8LTX1_9CNID|nr:unnamed protein product [Porites evermanni]
MDMIMLDVSRHSIKYPINVSLANCSSMTYREVPLLGSNNGSPVDQWQCVIVDDDLVCTLRLLAVKALLHHKIFHNDDTLALQCDLDKLGLWADRCQMVCKPTKCYKIFLYRSKSPK